ncbi:MAG: M4 family metallopeptidase [Saprospiraceae bacterium]|nr:M4 family metallopeptidase [Saprospiraceae bacterium]
MKKHHLTLLAILIAAQVFGQMKSNRTVRKSPQPIKIEDITPPLPIRSNVPAAAPSLFDQTFKPTAMKSLPRPVSGQPSLMAQVSKETGTPYMIQGEIATDPAKSVEQQVQGYLTAAKSVLKLKNPVQEFQIKRSDTDETGIRHTRLQQQWMGVPVYGGEAILHEKNGKFFLFNGRFYPSPQLTDVAPAIQPEVASQIALAHVGEKEVVKSLENDNLNLLPIPQQAVAELVIYHVGKTPYLAWHVTVVPNLAARYSYFVDAKTGTILNQHSELCKLAGHAHGEVRQFDSSQLAVKHETTGAESGQNLSSSEFELLLDGPATANALDLFGQSRLINTYQLNNKYFFIDASQTMFNSGQSVFPDEGVGVIFTIDAQNTSPENDNFGAVHVTSNNNSWNNPKAVSAHYHAEKAYDYFKNTFNRNSINGQGGNILSVINVVEGDGSQMDNAFWNGQFMCYGNGKDAFTAPLQKALDVAGHEMSHGVIQATANLEYFGESGALNESFADVFGAMIDRDDWLMGEDLTNTQYFPTGALRDLSNPHNGGNSLNDNGWQPAHYTERYQGDEDNGGVHINSGIVNKAFFLFTSNANVGKAKAEKVYYKALTDYLTHSSNFVDCRLAVVQAATDLHGANSAEVNAAKSAFDAVGIGSSGGNSGNQDELDTNPGENFILMTDLNEDKIYIFAPNGTASADPLTDIAPYSRPSVTDDGSTIVYIDKDNKMRVININWSNGSATTDVIQNDPIWHNVAISKDGKRIAALLLDDDNDPDNDNFLYIYDFDQGGSFFEFELTNPTTAQGGPSSDNVSYADVIEWDHTGQWVMYDALSKINTGTNSIEYWDINFIYAWDGGFYGNGYIEKLFSSLPENVSVGNPTFAKNSENIIAFDYFDEASNEYYLLGSNIETSDVGTIFQGSDLHWPNYSVNDEQLVFNAFSTSNEQVLAFIPVGSDKITPSGDATIYLSGKQKAVWFANGDRALAANDLLAQHNIRLYPNPVAGQLNLDFSMKQTGDAQVQVYDLMGRLVFSEKINAGIGENRHRISTEGLASGQYLLRLSMAEGQATMKFVKN